MSINAGNHWADLTAQQLVRYEALFELLGAIQLEDDIERIAQEVARRWKYFANVSAWRLQVPKGNGFLLIDGYRGEAHLSEVSVLPPWEAFHCTAQRPFRIRPEDAHDLPEPPTHLCGTGVAEWQVIPFTRASRCIALLSVAARHQSFNELDNRFIRMFGSYFGDRVCDILLRHEATNALIDKATRDALTGILNRGTIIDRLASQLAQAHRSGHPLSVVLGDIDLFKGVNDTHGHAAGDEVLREVARRLHSLTREGDSLGRYGGEEFLFVLYPCDAASAAQVAERMRRIIAETPVALRNDGSERTSLTISLGVATTPPHDEWRPELLLKRADDALYRSKAEGRNRVSVAT